jgi:succinate dehydrogenase / fumarate reductase membrane anchor subunit
MSFRSALGRVRGLGAAKDGTHHWWMQRVTAIALVPLGLWFAVKVVRLTGADWETAVTAFASPLTTALALLAIGAGFYHLKLGLQVVIEDYVHHKPTEIFLQLAQTFLCALLGLLGAVAVLKLGLL